MHSSTQAYTCMCMFVHKFVCNHNQKRSYQVWGQTHWKDFKEVSWEALEGGKRVDKVMQLYFNLK